MSAPRSKPISPTGRGRRWSPAAGALVALAAAVALSLTGCGVPGEERAQVIAADDLPFGLGDEDGSTTSVAPSGMFEPAGTETVSLYFPSGNNFVEVSRALPAPLVLADIVEALAAEPTETDIAYRSAVGPDDVLGVSVRAGVAIVELDKSFRELPNSEQRVAVAQLVLSLTARPGIGQIDFVIAGEPVQVPRADGTLDKASVSRDDFIELVTG